MGAGGRALAWTVKKKTDRKKERDTTPSLPSVGMPKEPLGAVSQLKSSPFH